MKLEFNLAVKAVPMADVHVNIDASAEELSIILADPVYQGIGEAIVAKLCSTNGNHADRGNDRKANDRVESLRRVVEAEHRCQANHNQNVNEAIKGLQDQVSKMLDSIVRDIRNK